MIVKNVHRVDIGTTPRNNNNNTITIEYSCFVPNQAEIQNQAQLSGTGPGKGQQNVQYAA